MENTIINGDCRDYLDQIPSDAFFISDPPYNQDYHYDEYGDKLDVQDYRDLLYEVFVGRKSAVILYPEDTLKILATLDIGDVQEVVSWVYPSNTAKQSRLISWWNCKPDFRKIGQPYKNPTDKRIAKRIAEGKMARGYDWWEINQVKNVSKKDNPHPCPIPDEVARRIILATTKPGDLVVDPFAGSGTVCKVAKELGRRFLGFEISKKYHQYTCEALTKLTTSRTTPHETHDGYCCACGYDIAVMEGKIAAHEDEIARKVGMLRQWLNEDRITDHTKIVTNEQILTWLGIRSPKE